MLDAGTDEEKWEGRDATRALARVRESLKALSTAPGCHILPSLAPTPTGREPGECGAAASPASAGLSSAVTLAPAARHRRGLSRASSSAQ